MLIINAYKSLSVNKCALWLYLRRDLCISKRLQGKTPKWSFPNFLTGWARFFVIWSPLTAPVWTLSSHFLDSMLQPSWFMSQMSQCATFYPHLQSFVRPVPSVASEVFPLPPPSMPESSPCLPQHQHRCHLPGSLEGLQVKCPTHVLT